MKQRGACLDNRLLARFVVGGSAAVITQLTRPNA